MPGLMHACDVLVQNAGGLTSLEAFAAGLPVASYRCIPGHGQTNAAALDEAGLAVWIRDPAGLGPVLAELLHGPRGQAQRTAGLALHASAPGPVPTIAAAVATGPLSLPTRAAVSTGPLPTRSARPAPKRFRGGRRLVLTAAATAATVSLGVAAPLAYAYSEAPARFTTVAHYLDGDGR
ncbi:UDP-N-acetylglucosamine--N-acetylglucosamine transferase, partial [Streptomyces sp. NPDC048288]